MINYCKSILLEHTTDHTFLTMSQLNNIIETSLSQLTSSAPNSIVCLAGNFNAPNIDWSNNINCQQYLLGVIEDYCMTQVATEFT